jgi:uncharacterized protein (TIRG00374 family)
MRVIHHNPPSMKQRVKKWITFSVRWGIAVVGIWWVLGQITWRDRVTALTQDNKPVTQRLAETPPLDATSFKLLDGRVLQRSELVSQPDQKKISMDPRGGTKVDLLAVDLSSDLKRVNRFLVGTGPGGAGVWVPPAQVFDYRLKVPHPLVEVGVGRMLRDAGSGNRPWLLILAVVIFPVTFIVTSVRWHRLLLALDIQLTLARAFALNMVGAFYNTFIPGSTGGDVLKAYYASKQTTHRTRAVMSVFVDRIIGLLCLVIMGGVMAAYQYKVGGPDDPASHACGRIAIVSALIVFATAAGLAVYYHRGLRRAFGLDWLLSKLPKQKQVKNAMQTMDLYGKHKATAIGALLVTFPVHITVVLSAMLAGNAFGLTISPVYYFVAVPVIVLVGSIPISFQGAGVMEYFAILLVGRQGGTVSQAFALTMSIRMVQILWNLTGGVFVFRGGYHQPTEAEQRDLGEDELGAAQAA